MKGRHLVLAVKDDGIGMDEAIRSRLPAESKAAPPVLDAGRGKRRRLLPYRSSKCDGTDEYGVRRGFSMSRLQRAWPGTVIEMFIPERGNADV